MKMIATLSSVFLLVCPLQAATLVFNGVLQGSQENPPVASPGTGMVELTVDSDTRIWSLVGNFSGLLSNSTDAHIHGPAVPGINAGIIAQLVFTPGVTEGTLSGGGTFTAPQFSDLLSELYYVNVHTVNHGGGELRAQLVPEPAAGLLALSFATLTLVRRRRQSAG